MARPARGSSELLPNIATHADKFCWLRGLHTDTPAHPQAVVHCTPAGANAAPTRPSMGSWLLYGLGSEINHLPGYVTINPPPNFGGAVNYGSAFLPAVPALAASPDRGYLPNVKAYSAKCSPDAKQLDLIQSMNRDLAATSGAPDPVDGIIELLSSGFRMQGKRSARAARTSRKNLQHVREAYGDEGRPAGRRLSPASASWLADSKRSRRALRRDSPGRLGPSAQQPAQGAHPTAAAPSTSPPLALLPDLGQRVDCSRKPLSPLRLRSSADQSPTSPRARMVRDSQHHRLLDVPRRRGGEARRHRRHR